MSEITLNEFEGWAQAGNARASSKWHYYRNERSLCGRCSLLFRTAPYEQGNDDSESNCPRCREKLLKERAEARGNK